jgi:HNH endonuclease
MNAEQERITTSADPIPYGYCHCGCGGKTKIATRTKSARGQFTGEPLRYLLHHNGRRGTSTGTKAFFVTRGRTYVMGRKESSSMLYSRVLMWNKIGREPRPDEIVHHVNGDPTDDRIENLEIVTRAQHISLHRASVESLRLAGVQKMRKRVSAICKICGESYEHRPSKMATNAGYCSNQCAREARKRGLIDNGRSSITHCPKGHAYDAANTIRRPNGHRLCRQCARDNNKAQYQKRKAART